MRDELLARTRAVLMASGDAPTSWRDTVRALADDLGPFYRRGQIGGCRA